MLNILATQAPQNNVINTIINANTRSQPKVTHQQTPVIHDNMSDNTLSSLTKLFQQSSNQLASGNNNTTNLENIASLLENSTIDNISIEDTNQDNALSAGDSIVLTLKNNTDGSLNDASFTLTENDVAQFNNILNTLETDQLTQQIMESIREGILFQMYQAGERLLEVLRDNPT